MIAKPIYIVGVGRSGTSLLQSMLGSHSQIATIPETSFLRRFVFAPKNKMPVIADDSHLARVPQLQEKSSCKKSKSDLLAVYTEELFSVEQSEYILDKDPRLIEYVPLIESKLNNAKVIVVFRDPRDVVASKKKAKWSAGRNLVSYLVSSRVQINDGEKLKQTSKVFLVKYEELLEDPQQVLEKLCDYLGLSFEQTMLAFQATAKKLVQEDEMDWKKETLQPLKKNNMNKWINELSAVEAYSSYLNVKGFCDENQYRFTIKVGFFTKLKSFFLVFLSSLLASLYVFKRRLNFLEIEREFDES